MFILKLLRCTVGRVVIHKKKYGRIQNSPKAQFVITGILGPQSNAHGPNEFIHIPYAKKLTASIASIIQQFPK